MDPNALYENHVQTITETTAAALRAAAEDGVSFEGIVFHAGSARFYHADDQPVPFRSVFHFRY